MADSIAPKRRIHLGIDFGTSQSKVVFRDYSRLGGDVLGAYAVVVRPTKLEGESGDFRIPSTVTWVDDKLFFGSRAELEARSEFSTPYRSLKVRMALPAYFYGLETPPPAGLSIQDLATLFVLYLIQRGHRALGRYPPAASGPVELTMTLGVPMSQLDQPELGKLFLDVARTAASAFRMEAPDLASGIQIDDAIKILGKARAAISGQHGIAMRDWIRAEASAALIWAFNSPLIKSGLYAVVDVGAGTTASSWFRIVDSMQGGTWTKSRMAFFGASCNPPGADAVELVVAKAIGQKNPAALRGNVNSIFSKRPPDSIEGLANMCNAIVRTYREAFGRAYPKQPQQSAWKDAQLFLVGGGSLIEPVELALRPKAWPQLDRDPPLMDPGHPADLFEENGSAYSSDSRYLLVAYGLSHLDADVPETVNPNDIPPFAPLKGKAHDIDHEDLYGKR